MSLSASEQQTLDSIKDSLASSDPTLVARLTMFARLASGEQMPVREKIHAGSRRTDRHLGLQGAALLLWLVTTIALIAVALTSSRDGSTCPGFWGTSCVGATSASSSASGVP